MRRWVPVAAGALALVVGAIAAHFAWIETSGEVIVLRTESADGSWLETRLWIVDDDDVSWLHGGDSRWVRSLRARPIVEIVRDGSTTRHRATPVPGPHPRVHELMRVKYGLADRWVRFLGPDVESTVPIRLERVGPRAAERS